MTLYNLFPLLAGPFSRWSEHFTRAAAMGFDWIFVNPIQQSGASRSLYSIADYFRINPALLDPQSAAPPEDQVRQMVAQARASGLKMMIDLVINHAAIDSRLTSEHPEWFLREPDGRVANSFCQHNGEKVVWKDLAQFDHPHTRDPEGLLSLLPQRGRASAGAWIRGLPLRRRLPGPAQLLAPAYPGHQRHATPTPVLSPKRSAAPPIKRGTPPAPASITSSTAPSGGTSGIAG